MGTIGIVGAGTMGAEIAHVASVAGMDVLLADADAAHAQAGRDRAVGIGARRRGVPLAQALQAFEDWAGPAPRLGFHVDFDRVLIERARRVAGLPATAKRWIDLAPLAAAMHPQVRAHALDEWLEHFGIECLARHEAVADTLATAELWLLLWPALQRAGVRGSAAAQALARNQRWLQR